KESEKEGDASATAQIFKNMLILEESLRQQYMQQQSLRLKYSIFLVVMVIIFSYSTYVSLFHSIYVLTNIVHQVISIIMLMTLLLFYLTGEYTRTISIPRKFLVTTNKGIRQLNVRLVKVKVPLKERIIGFIHLQLHNHRQGVDHARLVLNPRVFSTATREQWELYRNQFWGLESVRSR
ncbi:hypothetical protein PICMEDRAFT_27826, partial [Pichia membranifaciens NRRL Y-2026]